MSRSTWPTLHPPRRTRGRSFQPLGCSDAAQTPFHLQPLDVANLAEEPRQGEHAEAFPIGGDACRRACSFRLKGTIAPADTCDVGTWLVTGLLGVVAAASGLIVGSALNPPSAFLLCTALGVVVAVEIRSRSK
jgi:hypothetical protein